MSILLVNDDGYDSLLTSQLFEALSMIHRVIMVAPHFEQSAKGHSFTMNGPIRIHSHDENVYSIQGTPADCVYSGLHYICANEDIDLVVSGINNGANLGADIFYSGTVAAAREAAINRVPAIALSTNRFKVMDHPTHTRECVIKALEYVERGLASTWVFGEHWNINFPTRLAADSVERHCSLGFREYEKRVRDLGDNCIGIGGKPIPPKESESDVWFNHLGYITMTKLGLKSELH